MLSNLFFIHLIAWYRPSFTFWAFNTSEKVPSPFFATRRYFLIDTNYQLDNLRISSLKNSIAPVYTGMGSEVENVQADLSEFSKFGRWSRYQNCWRWRNLNEPLPSLRVADNMSPSNTLTPHTSHLTGAQDRAEHRQRTFKLKLIPSPRNKKKTLKSFWIPPKIDFFPP